MESTQTTQASTHPTSSITPSSDYDDYSAPISFSHPIELVAALPALVDQDLTDKIAFVFCHANLQTLDLIVSMRLPRTEAEHCAAQDEFQALICGPDSPQSGVIAIVAFASESTWELLDDFVTDLLDALLFLDDSAEMPAAFLVSSDGATATDLRDPDRLPVAIAQEASDFRELFEQKKLDVLAQQADVTAMLEGSPEKKTPELAAEVSVLASRRRTSARYRREVENSLYDWLTTLTEPQLSEGKLGTFESTVATTQNRAAWLVGVEDRRMREPVLKRIHNHASMLQGNQRNDFLNQVCCKLIALIADAPAGRSAAASSILALMAWQNSNPRLAHAAIEFGRRQDQSNVLLRLVSGATAAGLPTSAWDEIMATYSLTTLRAG